MQPSDQPLYGVCAALLVPRSPDGGLDLPAMERLVLFLRGTGIRSFALNGATGEYTRSSLAEVETLLCSIKALLGPDETVVLGVGAADLRQTQSLIDMGVRSGADGFLLPVPYFFPLSQADIMAFVSALRLPRPTYLYNLPSFTTAIEAETALALCAAGNGVVGVKDSSGSLDTMELLSHHLPGTGRIIGNDGALYRARQARLCDGVVSGVAGVLPELVQELYLQSSSDAESTRGLVLRDALAEYIGWLEQFPVPWGLKITAEFRKLFPAEYSLPLSEQRRTATMNFTEWLWYNRPRLGIT